MFMVTERRGTSIRHWSWLFGIKLTDSVWRLTSLIVCRGSEPVVRTRKNDSKTRSSKASTMHMQKGSIVQRFANGNGHLEEVHAAAGLSVRHHGQRAQTDPSGSEMAFPTAGARPMSGVSPAPADKRHVARAEHARYKPRYRFGRESSTH